jgi:hypothetical protein
VSDLLSMLSRLPPRKPRELLEDLAASARDSHPINITLHLTSGRDMRGTLIGMESGDSGDSRGLALSLSDDSGRESDDVSYVALESVEAVTVHGALNSLSILSRGSLETPPEGPPPTRLELKRKTEECSRLLSERLGLAFPLSVDWDSFPSSDVALWSIKQQIDAIMEAINDIASDEMGISALCEKARALLLSGGDAKSCKTEQGVITIQIAADSGQKGRFGSGELIKAMAL